MEEDTTHIAVFNGKAIRRVWHAERWWFVVEDIVSVLTGSNDPKQYIQKIKQRDEILGEAWVQIVHTLPIKTIGGIELSTFCRQLKLKSRDGKE